MHVPFEINAFGVWTPRNDCVDMQTVGRGGRTGNTTNSGAVCVRCLAQGHLSWEAGTLQCPKYIHRFYWRCRYLLCQLLCVLQTMCKRLDEEGAATLTESVVVPTLLSGLRQQRQPDLSHRVTTGFLPEHVEKSYLLKRALKRLPSPEGPAVPFDLVCEPFSQFVQRARVLAFNLPPSPQVFCQVLQLLALLLQLQIQHLQLL